MFTHSMVHRIVLFGIAVTLAIVTLAAPHAARAGQSASTPQLQRTIDVVLSRAKPREGKLMARDAVLKKVRQHGDIVMFDVILTDSAMIARARHDKTLLHRHFIVKMGAKFCMKGKGTRRFVDAGGEIQLVIYDQRNTMLAGGRLTKC